MNFLHLEENKTQLALFVIVGVTNTLVGYATYCLCVYFGIHYLIANVFSFIVGTTNAFYWSDKYVFKVKQGQSRNGLLTFIKTFFAYGLTGLIFNSFVLVLLIEEFGVSKYLAQLIGLTLRVPLNFILNKYWAYKVKNNGKEEDKYSDSML